MTSSNFGFYIVGRSIDKNRELDFHFIGEGCKQSRFLENHSVSVSRYLFSLVHKGSTTGPKLRVVQSSA